MPRAAGGALLWPRAVCRTHGPRLRHTGSVAQGAEEGELREQVADAIWEGRPLVPPAEVIEVPAAAAPAPASADPTEPPSSDPGEMARADEAWAEARQHIERLEQDRLERELDRLRREGPR